VNREKKKHINSSAKEEISEKFEKKRSSQRQGHNRPPPRVGGNERGEIPMKTYTPFSVAFALSGRGTLDDKTAVQVLDAFMMRWTGTDVLIMFKGDPLSTEPPPDGNDLLRASFFGEVGSRKGYVFWTKIPTADQQTLFYEMLKNHEIVGTFVLGGMYQGTIYVQTEAGIFTLDLTDIMSPVFMLDCDDVPTVVGFVNGIGTPRAAKLYAGPAVEPDDIGEEPITKDLPPVEAEPAPEPMPVTKDHPEGCTCAQCQTGLPPGDEHI